MSERMADDYLAAIIDMLDHEVDREFANTQLWLVFAELARARANEDTGELEAAQTQLQAAYSIIDKLTDYVFELVYCPHCTTDKTGILHEDDCAYQNGVIWLNENEAHNTG